MPKTAKRPPALLPMDCLCGQPVAAHFTKAGHKLACEQLTFLAGLQAGQTVYYWAHAHGHAMLMIGTIVTVLPDAARVELESGLIEAVASHRFLTPERVPTWAIKKG